MAELIEVLRPKRRPDSPDSSARGRYEADSDDVPSSSSQQSSKISSNHLNLCTELDWDGTKSMKQQNRDIARKERYLQKKLEKKQEAAKEEAPSNKWVKLRKY
jgi:hypothetical protein